MQAWKELQAACESCQKCGLWTTRNKVVFGTGSTSSPVMFIGEGPGKSEDLQGEPFVGRAGQLLDSMLASIGWSREKVYIANIVKCRPPSNRDPLPAEQDACMPYLERQIELINPKYLVCLGRVAAMRLIRPDFKITAEHGVWYDFGNGRKIMALYHPAALLRDPSKRGDTFTDLRLLEETVGSF
ncbi:MAG TPA: uracil-DNA glycosylase [Clostridiales bacterium]|jgi:uracil-DNA glycosylase family 4|nr:uracil-DNA glycosylase [Clostridiales bacterium]